MSTTDIPENAILGREMYCANKPLKEILAATQLTQSQLYFWLAGGPLIEGRRLLPEIERRVRRARRLAPGERVALIRRVASLSTRQMDAIQAQTETTADQREKDARTLAMITRTLGELTLIDERNRQMQMRKTTPDNDRSRAGGDERDIEELRRSVARKLENIIAEPEG